MIIRFDRVKDTHDFVTKFKKVNDDRNVIMRDITIQDNCVRCVISMRDDDHNHILMPIEYKKIKYKIIDRNYI